MSMTFRIRIFVVIFMIILIILLMKGRYHKNEVARKHEADKVMVPVFETRENILTLPQNTATLSHEMDIEVTDPPMTEGTNDDLYIDGEEYDYHAGDWGSSTRNISNTVSTTPVQYVNEDYDYYEDTIQSTTTKGIFNQSNTELHSTIKNIPIEILAQASHSSDKEDGILNSGQTKGENGQHAELRHHILDICNRNIHSNWVKNTLSSFVENNTMVSPKHNIAYCQIQKVGSTFWKRVIEFIRQKDAKGYQSPFDVKLDDLSLPRLFGSRGVKDKLLKKSYKFMFVRDPYERLFSGYVDKFFAPNPIFWKGIGRYIQYMTRNKSYRSPCGSDISFKEFVEYVIRSESSQRSFREKHFLPQYEHCSPCQIHYDFIGKMENKDDTMYMLRKLESLANLSLYKNDLASEIMNDTVYDMTKRLYAMKSDIKRCESMYLGMLRTWRIFQIRGILNKNAKMPFSRNEADHIPMRVFEQAIFTSHNHFGSKEQRILNRREAMSEAYRTLSLHTLQKIKNVFRVDFELFDYDSNSTRLFTNVTKGFSYFEL